MRYYLRPAQKEDAAAIAAIRGVADKETAAVVEAGVVDPGRQLMVALAATVDDKGEGAKADDVVVGVAEWSIPGNREADEEVAALLREGIGEESADGMYGLRHLSVNPDYKGKGIAGMLLDWALEKGQRERRGVYLLSDEDEYVLYEDMQFEEVAEGTFGGRDVWLMTWRPRTDVELGVCGAWGGEGERNGGSDGCE